MKCVVQLILFGTFLPLISSQYAPFFRKDYTYVEEFNAHYKIHWDAQGLSWDAAFLACDDEGATLFYPKQDDEWSLVKNLTADLDEPSKVTEVFVGLHDKYRVGEFFTIDGHSTFSPLGLKEVDIPEGNCILMNIDTGVYRVHPCVSDPQSPLPFVCKKVDEKPCPTIDREYKYIESSNKCYKINRRPRSWDEAMRTCFMEGGILAVLENKNEADALEDFLINGTTYHVGVRRTSTESVYYSVKGKRLDYLYQRERNPDSNDYYDQFGNQIQEDPKQECGAVYYYRNTLYTATQNCNNKLSFVCEMKANVL